MGYLGPENVFQLARERVFYQDMEGEISHHVERVCYYTKKPHPTGTTLHL